jgi:hypothetical protein
MTPSSHEPRVPGVEPALAHALADELVAITGQLADLAFDLASDPDTLRRHMHSLQAIDHITQSQLTVATLLRISGPIERNLPVVTLEELRARLVESVDRYRREGLPELEEIDDAA